MEEGCDISWKPAALTSRICLSPHLSGVQVVSFSAWSDYQTVPIGGITRLQQLNMAIGVRLGRESKHDTVWMSEPLIESPCLSCTFSRGLEKVA